MKLSNEVRIGIAVITAAVIFIAGGMYLRGTDLRSSQYALKVLYKNVNGLKTGDLVTVAGLGIGHVGSMALAGRQIAVDLQIQTRIRLPKDSEAILKSETIMGGKYIEVSPGSNEKMLEDGDSLAGRYEADLSELTSTLAPLSDKIHEILENVNTTFDQPMRSRIQGIVGNLANSSSSLEKVIRVDGDQFSQAIGDFRQFSRDLSTFARNLDSIALTQRENVSSSMTSLKNVAREVDKISAKMETATDALNLVLTRLKRGEGTLGKLIQDERLYNDIDSLTVNLSLLARDLRENPGRYVRVSMF
jgi:phospholipid/cholesterol/gamma-HCH transport system substrate-binding protein